MSEISKSESGWANWQTVKVVAITLGVCITISTGSIVPVAFFVACGVAAHYADKWVKR